MSESIIMFIYSLLIYSSSNYKYTIVIIFYIRAEIFLRDSRLSDTAPTYVQCTHIAKPTIDTYLLV